LTTRHGNAKLQDVSEQYLYLTTMGRVTGKAREIEIWFVEHKGKYYVLAEHREQADWVKNIARNQYVYVRIGQKAWDATARVLNAEHDRAMCHIAQELMQVKYGWGEGLPVEIAPYATC
jgi:deazaflavin-dependent oxidoreductase (nitroreductase family)